MLSRIKSAYFRSTDGKDMTDPNLDSLTAIIREYLQKSKSLVAAHQWTRSIFPEDLCELHFLKAGLAAASYPKNFFIFCGKSLEKLRTYVDLEGIKRLKGREQLVSENDVSVFFFRQRVMRAMNGSQPPVVFIPYLLREEKHWGCILGIPPENGKKGKVWWGDSLNIRPSSTRILSVVKTGMSGLILDLDSPKQEWQVCKPSENYMFDVLYYTKQTNTYSCGFYVISTAWSFASERPSKGFTERGIHEDVITERIRIICMRVYVSAVLQCASNKKTISDQTLPTEDSVQSFIQKALYGKSLIGQGYVQHLSRTSSSYFWPARYVENVTELCKWMHNLNEQGFFTSAKIEERPRRRIERRTIVHDYHIRFRCIEYRRKRRCPATIVDPSCSSSSVSITGLLVS